MKKKLSPSRENYLKAIYYLSQKEESVKSIDIAALLGVSKASVNTAMKKLSCDGLVQKKLYSQVSLTPAGRAQALAVIKKYDVIFSLLVDVLSVDISTAAQDACMIEHMVSDESIKAIDEFLIHLLESNLGSV